MTVYYIAIISCIILYPVFNNNIYKYNTDAINNDKKNNINIFYYIFISITLILIIGLRDVVIGIDTQAYKNMFLSVSGLSWDSLLDKDLVEPGYFFLQLLFNKIGIGFQGFLIFTGIMFILPVTYIIKKYSKIPWLSYFIFITFGFYTFGFSGIRQTLAMALTLIAFELMQRRKFILFILVCIAAFSLHLSAIVFILVYFLNRIKFNKTNITIFIIIAFIINALKNKIIPIMNSFARIEYDAVETGGDLMYLFLIGTLIIGVIYSDYFYEDIAKNSPFFFILFFVVIIFPLAQFNPAVLRIYFYFLIFIMIYVPNVLSSIKDYNMRTLGIFVYIIIFIYFAKTQVFIDSVKLSPYKFFWT